MKPRPLPLLGILALLLVAPRLGAAELTRDELEGRDLAAELRTIRPPESFTNRATLRITSPEGVVRFVPATVTTVVGGADDWRVTYAALLGATHETLDIRHSSTRSPVFLTGPSPAEGVPLSADQLARPFAGSDFWAGDLGLHFLHWPQQRLVPTDRPVMRKGRPCKILESENPAAPGYTRVRSWIDAEHKGLILAEAYNGSSDKPVKRFSIGSLKKSGGEWQLKDMEMIDEVRGSATRLEFDLTVK